MSGPGLRFFGEEEERGVAEVVRSRELSRYRFGGELGETSKTLDFERLFANFLGVPHCLGMNSCTSALLAGLLALELPEQAEVIVPAYTFVATLASVAYAGARPVLANVDDSLTLDPADVITRITPNTRAVVAVHMLGNASDMHALQDICARHGLTLIEDVAQAAGGTFRGRALGSFGSFGSFSFNQLKTFTAGDGGALATSDSKLFETTFAIHDHGSRPYRAGVAEGGGLLGLNLRMHELSAAVALAQLRKLPTILEACRTRKRKLLEAVGPIDGARPARSNDAAGDCGNAAVWLFDDASRAAQVAKQLGCRVLGDSPRHVLAKLAERSPRLPAAYRRLQPSFQLEQMAKGLTPTLDVLQRAVAVSVGVDDAYLGTGFGIGPTSTDAEIQSVADEFRGAARR